MSIQAFLEIKNKDLHLYEKGEARGGEITRMLT